MKKLNDFVNLFLYSNITISLLIVVVTLISIDTDNLISLCESVKNKNQFSNPEVSDDVMLVGCFLLTVILIIIEISKNGE